MGEPDNEFVYELCQEFCENEMVHTFPEHPTASLTQWTLVDTVCVFADNGNFGVMPDWDGHNVQGSAAGDCDNIPAGSETISPQCFYLDCVAEGDCPAEAQACTGWSPGSYVSSSLNTATKTYTTTVQKAFLEGLAADLFDQVLVCDTGGWTWSISATPDKWRMQNLASRDLLYKMGFRNGDEQVKIKKSGSSTWYNLYASTMLDGYAVMADAFGALGGETSFVLQFQRSGVTYTMNLTLS